jgi:hypothetical protein|tara:strand:+ start:4048 stop:4251 length:204 start_codon:yes stop_codon:yes gene_type:complete
MNNLHNITITTTEFNALNNLLLEVNKMNKFEQETGVDANFNGLTIKDQMGKFLKRNENNTPNWTNRF